MFVPNNQQYNRFGIEKSRKLNKGKYSPVIKEDNVHICLKNLHSIAFFGNVNINDH